MLSQNYLSPVFIFKLNLSDEKLLWYNTRKMQGIFEHLSRNYFSNALENQQFDSNAFHRLQGVAQTLCENKQCYEEKLNVRQSTVQEKDSPTFYFYVKVTITKTFFNWKYTLLILRFEHDTIFF